MKLTPYLNFNGTCAEAFAYYEKHLGAKTTVSMTFGQMPAPATPPPGTENLVLHARIALGDTYLMASDVAPTMPWEPMRSAYLTLNVDSSAEADTRVSPASRHMTSCRTQTPSRPFNWTPPHSRNTTPAAPASWRTRSETRIWPLCARAAMRAVALTAAP